MSADAWRRPADTALGWNSRRGWRACTTLVGAWLIVTACHDSPTAPLTRPSCGASSTFSLAPLQAITIVCSAATTVKLDGNGAAYLIVPQLAAGDVPNQAVRYTIGATANASGAISRHDAASAKLASVGFAQASAPRNLIQR